VYRLVEAVGPDHEKRFRIEVVVGGRSLGVGEGPSRRIAETSAAAEALDTIRRERQAARAARSMASRDEGDTPDGVGEGPDATDNLADDTPDATGGPADETPDAPDATGGPADDTPDATGADEADSRDRAGTGS